MADAAITPKQVRNAAIPATWWLEACLGVLSIVAGVTILARPGDSLTAIAVISGVFVVLDSIFEIVTAFDRQTESRPLAALLGVLGIIAGVLLIRHPVKSVAAIALILGIWLMCIGAVRLASTFAYERRLWSAILGPVQIVAGIVIVASPGIGLTTLAVLAGVSFVLNGMVLIAIGFLGRSDAPRARVSADAAGAS